jgi:tetratricopeptide (TPR) repeat protein
MPLFERAVELDPEFAFAHSHLGRVYADLGEPVRALDSITLAYRLRQIASGQESFFIIYNYRREVLRNLDLARQTCVSSILRHGPLRYLDLAHLRIDILPQVAGTGQPRRVTADHREALAPPSVWFGLSLLERFWFSV